MPYKDAEESRNAAKERKRKQRGVTKGVTLEGVTGQGVTYPHIVHSLVDKDKRLRLEKIHACLKGRGLLREVRYGVFGPTFEVVGELLEVTR